MNLIEHNRRNATDKVIEAIALALDLPTATLSEGAESTLLAELREIAATYSERDPELDAVEEFVGRFPGWANTIAAQGRQERDLSSTIATLTDRLNFDPHLQQTLHEMLTTITAIRSTAGILAQETDLSSDQAHRFQNIVHDESVRLSRAAQDLVTYFDHAEEERSDGGSAQEEFEQFLARSEFVFPELEHCNDAETTVDAILRREAGLTKTEARARVRQWLLHYADDARNMPLAAFADRAREVNYAPSLLASEFSQDLFSVFRRLSVLARTDVDAPAFGLVVVNAAGHPMFRRPLPDFSLPRFSTICALWPVFRAFSNLAQPIEEIITLPNGREFLARAVALPLNAYGFDVRATYASAMIVTSINDAQKYGLIRHMGGFHAVPVGTSCRLCQREDCIARSDPSILPPPSLP